MKTTFCTQLRRASLAALLVLTASVACSEAAPTAASAKPNPALAEVPLPAAAGWNATLVLDNAGVGIWTVEAFQVFPQSGTLEIVGLDDLGRAQVCSGYSGKWTTTTVVSDGKWLGGLAHGDIDPRIGGAEIYTGSQQGNLYQVVAWPHGILDYRLIAHLPGREIHTIVAGDLDAASRGPELIVFTRPGGVYRVTPTGKDGTFETKPLMDYDGRVRQALVLPLDGKEAPAIATVSHNGKLELLRLTRKGPSRRTIYEETMGLGRVALRPPINGQPLVLYTAHDDGRILRHEQGNGDHWATETIYLGPQGSRGVVAGCYGATPDLETVATFGYSKRVELLTRTPSGWRAETVFEDLDKGHWLATAELDGRNATREIITSGYSGRMVLLARPPGFGRSELAVQTPATESFETTVAGALPGGWTAAITGEGTSAWSVVACGDAPSGTNALQQSAWTPKPSYPLCLAAPLLKDGFVEVKFKALSGTNDQAGGVVWRARDANDYYVCRANALEHNVVLYKVENGKRTALDIVRRQGGYGVEAKVAPAQWHTLRVDFAAPQFRVALDGKELFAIEDSTFSEAGKVGLWTKADSATLFDDFRWGGK